MTVTDLRPLETLQLERVPPNPAVERTPGNGRRSLIR